MAPTVRGTISALLAPDLRKVYVDTGKERPLEYPSVFNVQDMEWNPVTDQQVSGLGTLPAKAEGVPFSLDELLMGGAESPTPESAGSPWWSAGGIIETAGDVAQSVVDLATGEKTREFDLPELGTSGPSVSPVSSEGMKMMGAYLSTSDPQAIADIAVKTLPGATRKNDKFGNAIVTFEGKDFYVNDPGFSEADAFQLLGMLVEFMPAAKLGSLGKGIMARMGRTGIGFGATSVGLDAAAIAQGSEQGIDVPKAAITAALGGAAEVIMPIVARAWQAFRGNPGFVDAQGNITGTGRRYAQANGVAEKDFAEFMAANEKLAAEYAAEAANPTHPKYAKTYAEGREFGIELTSGQAEVAGSGGRITGGVRMEEAMAGGRFGSEAEAAMRAKRGQQRQQVADAGERIQGDLAGGEARIQTPADAGAVTAESVQSAAAQQESAVGRAYTAAGETDMRFEGGTLGTMFKSITAGLKRAGVVIESAAESTKLYPATRKAFDAVAKLNREVAKGKNNPVITKQSLRQFELTRRRIMANINAATNDADRRGATVIKKEFDGWLDDAVDNALFSGDPEALALLKTARAERTKYGRLFEGKDDAGKVITRILEREPTAEETINLIFGRAGLGMKEGSVKVLQRLKKIFGNDSAEWASLREAAWLRVFKNRKGEIVSPRVLDSNLKRAMNEAPTLMRELFSKTETARIRRFSDQALRTLTPDDLVNYSRTADALSHWFRLIIGRLGTRATFSGDPLQAAGLHAVARAPNFFSGRQARNLISPRPPPLSLPSGVAGAGALGQQ